MRWICGVSTWHTTGPGGGESSPTICRASADSLWRLTHACTFLRTRLHVVADLVVCAFVSAHKGRERSGAYADEGLREGRVVTHACAFLRTRPRTEPLSA